MSCFNKLNQEFLYVITPGFLLWERNARGVRYIYHAGKIEILSLLPARRRKIKMETDNAEELSYVNNDESSSFYSENDEQYSDDDFGSECSCSTCSTCSTCELCEEELAEEEFGDSSDEEMRHNVPRCEPNLQFCNSDSDNTEKQIHALNNELQRTTKNGYKTDEQYIIEKVANVVVLKADASQFQNGGYITGKGKTQELLLGGKQRKKRVTFFDSSSSSDVQAEAFSISSLSDSSTSGCCADFNQHLQNGDNFDHKTISSDPVKEHSNDLSEGDLDREYHRLKSVLKTIDPSKLLGVLKHSLKTKDLETINALGTLLPKNKFTADTVHCVRCHKEYDPHFGRKRCTLYHPEKDVWKISQNSQGATFKCGLCSSLFTLQGACDYKPGTASEKNCGICFEGVHTPDPNEVSYQPSGAAQCCEDKGCIEFYV